MISYNKAKWQHAVLKDQWVKFSEIDCNQMSECNKLGKHNTAILFSEDFRLKKKSMQVKNNEMLQYCHHLVCHPHEAGVFQFTQSQGCFMEKKATFRERNTISVRMEG